MDTNSIQNIFELTAIILSDEEVKVTVSDDLKGIADYNLITKELRVSLLKEHQHHLMLGLLVHEIGHVCFTNPTEDDMVLLKKKGISRLMNVVEDGYQERRICGKYIGAKKHLKEVFYEFFIKDPMPITENKVVEIVNILNYNCKGIKQGYCLKYPDYVEPQDLLILKKAEELDNDSYRARELFVDELADALKKYDNSDDLEKKKQSDPSDEKGEKSDSSEESGDPSDSNGTPDTGTANEDSKKKKSLDEILDEHVDELNDHHEKFEQEECDDDDAPSGEVASASQLIENSLIKEFEPAPDRLRISAKKYLDSVMSQAKGTALSLFNTFNLKRNALNVAKTQYKTSGNLDPYRMIYHSISDDIFQTTEIQTNQTNHGFVVMVDFSVSMDNVIGNVINKIIELYFFCKMAEVDFVVYAFTTSTYGAGLPRGHQSSKFYKLLDKHSSYQDAKDLVLYYLARSDNTLDSSIYQWTGQYSMHGTNILEAVIYGHELLRELDTHKKKLILLTDGEDAGSYGDLIYNGKKYKASDLPKGINIRNEISKEINEFFKKEYYHDNLCIYVEPEKPSYGLYGGGRESKSNEYMFDTYIKMREKLEYDGILLRYVRTNNVFINQIVDAII